MGIRDTDISRKLITPASEPGSTDRVEPAERSEMETGRFLPSQE
jgi:hypothetical protein